MHDLVYSCNVQGQSCIKLKHKIICLCVCVCVHVCVVCVVHTSVSVCGKQEGCVCVCIYVWCVLSSHFYICVLQAGRVCVYMCACLCGMCCPHISVCVHVCVVCVVHTYLYLCVASRKGVRNWRTFVKLSAFVMAYSFTDEEADHLGSTMMVPFVDLLNHSSTNHVELTFHPSCLQLLAVRNIHKVREGGLF